jgi:NitT/TauT family transport system substrate-binding protein
MAMMQTRRDFATMLAGAGAAGFVGVGEALADEGPPETTTIRIRRDPSICTAPQVVAEDLLRAEGFTDIYYVPAHVTGAVQMMIRGEIDFGIFSAMSVISHLDTGAPLTAVAGLHVGCFELFAHEPIRTIRDLKGKRVGIDVLGSGKHRYVAIMAASIGLDPHQDIEWVEGSALNPAALFPMELFAQRKVDAFLGFPPEPQELRTRGIGRVILDTTREKPWSQYFCCIVVGSRNFVRNHPATTKHFLRALLKANDMCAATPERAAQLLINSGYIQRHDYALQTLTELPYGAWREFDAEDSLRFFALRLHEVDMIRSNPKQLLTEGTDWRFLNELRRELKA